MRAGDGSWAAGADPAEPYRKLTDSCLRNGLKAEADFYARSAAALMKAGGPPLTPFDEKSNMLDFQLAR